ncbi:kinase-like domain-containing protein [Paraphysoderma sedebokerense]|nr:kinase-like domain-containing protein [Paraphysoderma sedebokerense]
MTSPPLTVDFVRRWDTTKVQDWLKENKLSKYTKVFKVCFMCLKSYLHCTLSLENDITGEILLELNHKFLKELNISSVGDRVRVLVAIKNLRTSLFLSSSTSSTHSLPSQTPVSPHSPLFSPTRQKGSVTPENGMLSSHNNSKESLAPPTPGKDWKFSLSRGLFGMVEATPVNTTENKENSSSLESSQSSMKRSESGIMAMDFVKQHCLKVTGEDDQTRIVNIQHFTDAKSVIEKILQKFNIQDDPDVYCIFVTSSQQGAAHALTDEELIAICRDSERVEREKLILRKKHLPFTSQSGSHKGRQKVAKLENFFGERVPEPPPPKTRNTTQTKLKNFFGERPPSELISSNLAEFFPKNKIEKWEQRKSRSIRKRNANSMISSVSTNVSESSEADFSADYFNSLQLSSSKNQSQSPSATSTISQSPSSTLQRRKPLPPSEPIPAPIAPPPTFLPPEPPTVTVQNSSTKPKPNIAPLKIVSPAGESSSSSSNASHLLSAKTTGSSTNLRSPSETDFANQSGSGSEPQSPTSPANPGIVKWMKGVMIGQGSFGSVFLGMNALSGELMAVKQVELAAENDNPGQERKKMMVEALQREISLLKDLDHPNIVRYLGSQIDETYLNIFLEYVPGGSVASQLVTWGPYEPALIKKYLKQVLLGLNYLHEREIIHRDIKGANILVDNKGSLKISDFGISKKVENEIMSLGPSQSQGLQGSVYWMAPEVVKQMRYTRKSDIWSLGCLVLEMYTATHPWPNCGQVEAIFKIGSYCVPEIPQNIGDDAKEFLDKTFQLEYLDRPSAEALLMHPFLTGV